MYPCYLKDRFEWAPVLSRLHAATWGHLYASWSAADALREFESEYADGTLPVTILALDGQTLLGSISLVYDDLPGEHDLNPWVASFYVRPGFRGAGVGTFLLGAAHELLQRQGVTRAYLFTENAQAFFRRFGWFVLRQSTANGHVVEIMTRSAPWHGPGADYSAVHEGTP